MIKLRSPRSIAKGLGRLVLLLLLFASAAAWKGQIFGIKSTGNKQTLTIAPLAIGDAKQVFPTSHKIKERSEAGNFSIYDKQGDRLGSAVYVQGGIGYGGRVPMFVFSNDQNQIAGLVLGKNYESYDYLADVIKSGYLTKWNGVAQESIATHEVDVVSGATITSEAIKEGLMQYASVDRRSFLSTQLTMANLFSLLLLVVMTLAYFSPKKFMSVRWVILLLGILILGFWQGRFISFVQVMNWMANGINWRHQLLLAVMLILSILFPILFGRTFYCAWVCPFGAAQELCGKACSKKFSPDKRWSSRLKYVREILFYGILVSLWVGFAYDLTYLEPFSAFSLSLAGTWALMFASFFLVLSVFVSKPWCNYFCPTGHWLEWIRKEDKK